MRNAETILDIIRNDTDHWKADLRSKDSRAVWRGAVGKVLSRVTRWQPTLPQARFGGGSKETYSSQSNALCSYPTQ